MRLTEILARQAAIRARLLEIEDTTEPGPDADDAARAAYTALPGETDALLDEWDNLETERVPLAARAERMDTIRSAVRTGMVDRGPDVIVRQHRSAWEDLESVRSGQVPAADLIARARTAVEQAPEHLDDTGRQHITQVLDRHARDPRSRQAPLMARHLLLTGSPEYHNEFIEYARSRHAGEQMRAALSLTDANGGFLVPFTLDPTIILTNAGVQGTIREIARNVQTATDTWSGVSSAGVTAEWLAEGSEAADASPTFAQPTITPKKASAYIEASYEVLQDSGFANELGMLLADAKVRLEEAALATANSGATRPRGVIAGVAAVTASLVTSATTGALVVGDVYNLAAALPARYKSNSTFLASEGIANRIRQFDTAGGSAFWANLGMGIPEQLLGKPVYMNSTMVAAPANAALVALVGDFRNYVVVDRIGMTVLYEPMVKGSNRRPTGQGGWFAYWRVGADVVNADAFRLLQLNQTAAAVALA